MSDYSELSRSVTAEAAAPIEAEVADGLEVIGQGEGCEAAAGLESGLADGGDALGNGERDESAPVKPLHPERSLLPRWFGGKRTA